MWQKALGKSPTLNLFSFVKEPYYIHSAVLEKYSARNISLRAIQKINSADCTWVPVMTQDDCRIKVVRLLIKLNHVYIADQPMTRDIVFFTRLSWMEKMNKICFTKTQNKNHCRGYQETKWELCHHPTKVKQKY